VDEQGREGHHDAEESEDDPERFPSARDRDPRKGGTEDDHGHEERRRHEVHRPSADSGPAARLGHGPDMAPALQKTAGARRSKLV